MKRVLASLVLIAVGLGLSAALNAYAHGMVKVVLSVALFMAVIFVARSFGRWGTVAPVMTNDEFVCVVTLSWIAT